MCSKRIVARGCYELWEPKSLLPIVLLRSLCAWHDDVGVLKRRQRCQTRNMMTTSNEDTNGNVIDDASNLATLVFRRSRPIKSTRHFPCSLTFISQEVSNLIVPRSSLLKPWASRREWSGANNSKIPMRKYEFPRENSVLQEENNVTWCLWYGTGSLFR